jgi:hypothetical protein
MLIRQMRHLFAVSFFVILSACAQDPFRPLADALLHKNEQSGPQASTPPSSGKSATTLLNADKKAIETCKKVAFTSGLDVDTAYARAISAFQFRTWAQRKRYAELNSGGFIDDGFRHDAQPGVLYSMSDRAEWNDTQGVRKVVWIIMQLAKEGSTKTRVEANYCIDSRDPEMRNPQWPVIVEKRIRESLA